MSNSGRAEWAERRRHAIFFLIAERTSQTWTFFERESHEVRWFPVAASAERIGRAERLCGHQVAAVASLTLV